MFLDFIYKCSFSVLPKTTPNYVPVFKNSKDDIFDKYMIIKLAIIFS